VSEVLSPEQALAPPLKTVRSVRRIQPSRGLIGLDVPELWQFRELLYYLIWRDVKSRYKQTFLGAFWAIFRPFISMVIMSVIFGKLAGITSGTDVPYPLFLFTGVLLWTYFSSTVSSGSASMLGSGGLISKAYFPRLYIPFAGVTTPLVDFALAFSVLIGLFAWYQFLPPWQIVTMPVFLVLTLFIGFGIALWLAPVTVRFRDIPFALPFLLQLGMYATPVIYPVTLVSAQYRWVLSLNPMTGATEGFRWSLLGGAPPGYGAVMASIGIATVLVATGLFYFRRAERTLVDLI
jgi:lipopolysaccharide transport system permease protein